MKKLIFLNPRGPCAGVDRALIILEKALEKYGSPIYVNHEIVHNEFVVQHFEKKGVIFNIPPHQVPKNSVYIFSAHGISPVIREQAKKNNLIVIDATCPLVKKVQSEAKIFTEKKLHILYIGHKNHPEAEGVMGISKMTLVDSPESAQNIQIEDENSGKNLTLLTQTTLSIDETSEIINILQSRFPNLIVPRVKDICYATQNRQQAVKDIALQVNFVLVVGSAQSSNSVRLVETAQKNSCSSVLVSSPEDIPFDLLKQAKNVAITSGASVPEELLEKIIEALVKKFPNCKTEHQQGKKENIVFDVPKI